jgi:hypothetical protein
LTYGIKIAEYFKIKHDNVEYTYTTQTDNRCCDLYQGVLIYAFWLPSFSIFTIFLPKIGKFMRLGSQAQLASFGTLVNIIVKFRYDSSALLLSLFIVLILRSINLL